MSFMINIFLVWISRQSSNQDIATNQNIIRVAYDYSPVRYPHRRAV